MPLQHPRFSPITPSKLLTATKKHAAIITIAATDLCPWNVHRRLEYIRPQHDAYMINGPQGLHNPDRVSISRVSIDIYTVLSLFAARIYLPYCFVIVGKDNQHHFKNKFSADRNLNFIYRGASIVCAAGTSLHHHINCFQKEGIPSGLINIFRHIASLPSSTLAYHMMENRQRSICQAFTMNYQPLTPESPCLPTILPHVRETIPTLPITPPSVDFDSETESVLSTAVHVLLTEATALSHLSRLYQTEPIARNGFVNAVNCVAASIRNGGKLVIAGVGKSGKVGEKLVATMNSLGILTVFLHPVEALHGDLGSVRQNDTILLITFSGRTPELCALIPHLPPTVSLIALTAHDSPANSPLTRSRPDSILLPAPIHESEESSFGMSAPTTSTTVAMALGDALAVAIARKIHTVEGRGPREVFKSFHPGGAIGMAPLVQGPPLMLALGTQLSSMPLLPPTTDALSTLDVVMAAVQAPKGWLRFSPDVVLPPRRIKQLRDMTLPIALVPNLGVNKDSWITVPAQSTVEEVLAWVLSVRSDPTKCFLDPGAVFGLVEDGEVNALVEVEQLFE